MAGVNREACAATAILLAAIARFGETERECDMFGKPVADNDGSLSERPYFCAEASILISIAYY